jgi:predicted molibdopterin-dependent oxidoreductase YjgC
MSESVVEIIVDGRPVSAAPGSTVAAALIDARQFAFRSSVSGDARGPLCGMGVCYECRVTIGGVPHQRACLRVVEQGMRIETAEDRA